MNKLRVDSGTKYWYLYNITQLITFSFMLAYHTLTNAEAHLLFNQKYNYKLWLFMQTSMSIVEVNE